MLSSQTTRIVTSRGSRPARFYTLTETLSDHCATRRKRSNREEWALEVFLPDGEGRRSFADESAAQAWVTAQLADSPPEEPEWDGSQWRSSAKASGRDACGDSAFV